MNYNWNKIEINNLGMRKPEKWTLIWLQVAIKNSKYLLSTSSYKWNCAVFVFLWFTYFT